MPNKEIKHPDKKADTGAYSAGVEVDGWVYVSGQGPLNLATGEVVHGTIEEETRRTLDNIDKILQAAGCGRGDIVKCSVHLSNINDFQAFNATYAAFFEGVRPLPTRTTVQSVLIGNIKVEIDAIARKREG